MRVAESPQCTDLPPPPQTFRLPTACISQELRSPSVTDQTQQGSLQQLYQKERPGHLQQWHLGDERLVPERGGGGRLLDHPPPRSQDTHTREGEGTLWQGSHRHPRAVKSPKVLKERRVSVWG